MMTTTNPHRLLGILAALALAGCAFHSANAHDRPLKVYILAGQSNMQGSAHKDTFAAMGDDPQTAPLLREILDQDGEPVASDNAWITYLTGGRAGETVLQGKVQVGYGFDSDRIGPEYAFGLTLDKVLDEPVLLIKTAWGGKSLAVDFRPPSAGPYEPSAKEKENGNVPAQEQVGHYYREMIRFVRATLQDADSIRKVVPGYDARQGYELAGFVWFQGWNDMVNRHHLEQYTANMIHFISDVRRELDVPKLPFIVGILGVYGTDPDSRKFDKWLPASEFRKAQFAAVEQYDRRAPAAYRGNVVAVDSGPFYELELSDIYWKRRLTSNWKRRVKQGEMTPEKFREECARYGFGDGELTAREQRTWDRCASNAEYHYLGSGKTFIRFGKALAEAMLSFSEGTRAASSQNFKPVKHLIDTHIHFYDTTRKVTMSWPPKDDKVLYKPHLPAEYSQLAKAAGVTGVVIVEASNHLQDNRWVLDLVQGDNFYLGLVGNVDVYRDDFEEQLLKLKQDRRFVGVRPRGPKTIDYANERVLANLAVLAKHNLTMDYLTNSGGIAGIEAIDRVARAIPDLRIVVNHCLGYDFDGKAPSRPWIAAVERLAENKNVSCKISGLYQRSVPQPAPQDIGHYQTVLDVLWKNFGKQRLIYGSNWPVTKHTGSYASFVTLVDRFIGQHGQDAREHFYWKNAAAAYRLPLH